MSRRAPRPDLAAVRAGQAYHAEVNEHFTPQFQRLDLTEELRSYPHSGLVMVGEFDPLVPAESAAATAAAFGGELRVVPDAAHDLLVDAPDALIDALRQTLDSAGVDHR
ncbi:hypothetical protein Aple_081240 [Acrocarpospora pleiomorpha]|uniref:AB hydrolase-1 domain-containing protein n=1 Tax=Acrocarpospora pleiomorpha TaxID=90975 RepID=A0A5M3XVL1_9ACTN|nr:hypothetical protein [Acrocarpospora pleiomorpha]GES25225.1 hypothetical protein Aple_081240 [Acrocarpospora pleiomorpha]